MIIKLKSLHTIIMCIGISGSGKSTTARKIDKVAKNNGLKSVILSSDECRHEMLLDNSYFHQDKEMGHVSDKAFKLLMQKFELYLRWPYNANLIILDMMNLYMEDRQKIIDLAKKYCYDIIALVFDYSYVEDYFSFLDGRYDKRIIRRQLKKFHQDTLSELGKKLYDDMIRIRSRDTAGFDNVDNIKLEFDFDFDYFKSCHLENDKNYLVVSDIHECINTFKELLKRVGFEIGDGGMITGLDDVGIIVGGDILDKGGNTKETVEFFYNNMDRMNFVWGNHDKFVYRYLKGELKRDTNKKYYTSIEAFNDNDNDNDNDNEKELELKQKFLAICDKMKPFVENKHFVVTHAGCEYKFIGKTQAAAIKAQRYYPVDRFDDSVDGDTWLENRREWLKYMKEESEFCHKLHIFGHECWENYLVYKNRVGIDTGCSNGGKLTGILVDRWSGKYRFFQVGCKDNIVFEEKLREFSLEDKRVELKELDEKDYSRLVRNAKNKINFISGTMCPADKFGDELEDINQALNYFKNKGIEKVMLQVKYMGSRCNIYLFDDVEKSYAVTRNGYLVRLSKLSSSESDNMMTIYKKLRERLNEYFVKNDLEMMIIDGELMPWSALGEDLIDSTFKAINEGISSEIDLLDENGFEEQLGRLNNERLKSDFEYDRCAMKKEELYKKYDAQKYESYKMLSGFYMPSIEEMKRLHSLYDEQLENYGSDNNIHYQAFSILKSVKKNGDEIIYFDDDRENKEDNETLFKMVNDAEYEICELNQDGYKKAREFFERVTNEMNLEGVVVKPLKIDNKRCAPYMKVRSKKYLTIIYGYDYLNEVKYRRLLEQKRISTKLRKSISEWNIGKELLKIPYKDISENNLLYMHTMTKMILDTNEEKNLDPRL